MGISFTIQTIIETVVVGLLIWGLFNDDRVAAFEKRLFANIRRRKLKLCDMQNKAD